MTRPSEYKSDDAQTRLIDWLIVSVRNSTYIVRVFPVRIM